MWLAGINTHTTLDTKSSSQAGQIPSAAGWYEHPHHIGYEKFIADRPNSKCGWLVLTPTPHWIRKGWPNSKQKISICPHWHCHTERTTMDYGVPTNQVRWELLYCCRHLYRVILHLHLLVNALGELKIGASPALCLCFPIPNRESTAIQGSNLLSNSPARHAVNVTEKLAVRRTRSKVREADCARNDMGERQTQLLAGRPRARSARIYFNRKEDTGPQTPCSRRASLQKSSQSCFLVHGKK